jgi:hypothetical protein
MGDTHNHGANHGGHPHLIPPITPGQSGALTNQLQCDFSLKPSLQVINVVGVPQKLTSRYFSCLKEYLERRHRDGPHG